jgi:hypothetical protein
MELGNFLEHFMTRGGREITKTRCGMDWATYWKLSELTKYIKFTCDFDKDSLCKARRYNKVEGRKIKLESTMCCCSGCKPCIGFHYQLPSRLDHLEKYAKMFNKDTGFWRPKKGCILPRGMRSHTCTTYNCNDSNYRYNAGLDQLHKILRFNGRGDHGQRITEVRELFIIDGQNTTMSSLPYRLERWIREEEEKHGTT